MYSYFVFPINSANIGLIPQIKMDLPSVDSEQRDIILCKKSDENYKLGNWCLTIQYYCCLWLLAEEINTFNNIGITGSVEYPDPNAIYSDFSTLFSA